MTRTKDIYTENHTHSTSRKDQENITSSNVQSSPMGGANIVDGDGGNQKL